VFLPDIKSHGLPECVVTSGASSPPSERKKGGGGPASISVSINSNIFEPVELFKVRESGVWGMSKNDKVLWKSEFDVQTLVKAVLVECVKMTGQDLDCCGEVSLVNFRPDLWLVRLNHIPVGVVEVKIPGDTIMESVHVHGQILDYMLLLRERFGVQDCWGIVSTYEQWRVYHLHEGSQTERSVECSAVFYRDHANLIHVICGVLKRMCEAKIIAPDLSILDPDRSYIQVHADGWGWETPKQRVELQFDGSMPTADKLFLISELGCGLHGRVHLACSEAGLVCALKFSNNSSELDKERQAWCKANPKIPQPIVKRLNAQHVLQMVYAPLIEKDQANMQDIESAIGVMGRGGIHHTDLKWPHAGMYREEVVFLDFGTFKIVDSTEDAIISMLQSLKLS
jgi:hypothetical protein